MIDPATGKYRGDEVLALLRHLDRKIAAIASLIHGTATPGQIELAHTRYDDTPLARASREERERDIRRDMTAHRAPGAPHMPMARPGPRRERLPKVERDAIIHLAERIAEEE